MWLNTNSPNQGDDKTPPPNTLMAGLLGSQKQGGELLVEQTGNETQGHEEPRIQRSCHNPVGAAFIQWWLQP